MKTTSKVKTNKTDNRAENSLVNVYNVLEYKLKEIQNSSQELQILF